KLWDAGRVIALPLQPGERPSPEEPARVESDNPDVLLRKETMRLIHSLASTHDRLWLVVDGSPHLWWSVRPVERFLSSHYYPLERHQTGDLTWLVEFSTIDAPDAF